MQDLIFNLYFYLIIKFIEFFYYKYSVDLMAEHSDKNDEDIEILDDELNSDIAFKIIVIGNSGVGKSCLSLKATKDVFQNDYSLKKLSQIYKNIYCKNLFLILIKVKKILNNKKDKTNDYITNNSSSLQNKTNLLNKINIYNEPFTLKYKGYPFLLINNPSYCFITMN